MSGTVSTNERVSVAEGLDLVGTLIRSSFGTLTLVGTIHGFTAAGRWRRCDLVTYNSAEIVARIHVAIPPDVTLPDGPAKLDGAVVAIAGRFEINRQYGPLQFIAAGVSIQTTRSAAARRTDETVELLRQSGAVRAQQSLRLPERPQRIGLIAPLNGGAGGTDFLNRLHAAKEVVQINSRYIPMGGPDSLAALVEAIRELSVTDSELIFICRGGGPRSGLAVFDSPEVLRAICEAPLPVLVAVGHASDQTAADLVCHISLPTPSAAAAWLIDHRRQTARARLVAEAAERMQRATVAQRQAQVSVETAAKASRQAERARSIATWTSVSLAVLLITVAALLLLSI